MTPLHEPDTYTPADPGSLLTMGNALLTGDVSPALPAALLPVAAPSGDIGVLAQPLWTADGTIYGTPKLYALHLVTPEAATIEEILPAADHTPGGTAGTSARLLVYTGAGYDTWWLWTNAGSPIWRTNASPADAGATEIPAGAQITVGSSPAMPFTSGLMAQWVADETTLYKWLLTSSQSHWMGTGHRPGGLAYAEVYDNGSTGTPAVSIPGGPAAPGGLAPAASPSPADPGSLLPAGNPAAPGAVAPLLPAAPEPPAPGDAVKYSPQSRTAAEKATAAANIGTVTAAAAQTPLTAGELSQFLDNLGRDPSDSVLDLGDTYLKTSAIQTDLWASADQVSIAAYSAGENALDVIALLRADSLYGHQASTLSIDLMYRSLVDSYGLPALDWGDGWVVTVWSNLDVPMGAVTSASYVAFQDSTPYYGATGQFQDMSGNVITVRSGLITDENSVLATIDPL